MEIKKKEPTTKLTHRRKGAGYDNLGNIFRGIKEFAFSNGFRIINRPGRTIEEEEKLSTGFINVKNAFELFYDKVSNEGIQSIVFGRQGDGESRHTNLVDISATHNSTIGSKEGRNNGYIKLRVTRDDENPVSDRSGVNVYDPGTVNDVGLSGVAIQIVGQGTNGGGVVISNIVDKEDSPTSGVPFILVDSDGIQMYNLPTSDPGVAGAIWRSGGDLRISV